MTEPFRGTALNCVAHSTPRRYFVTSERTKEFRLTNSWCLNEPRKDEQANVRCDALTYEWSAASREPQLLQPDGPMLCLPP